jgi:hypothetical protein
MIAFEVPLAATPQTLTISLSGTVYNLLVRWSQIDQIWLLDINDQGNNPVVTGINMTTGGDLLKPYRYLGFVGSLYVQTDTDTLALPSFTNLGSTSHLYYVPDGTS